MTPDIRNLGEACVASDDGECSDAALHEALTAGVEDSDLRAQTRAKLLAAGVPAAALDRLFPDLPAARKSSVDC
jgi:hypothetical protein